MPDLSVVIAATERLSSRGWRCLDEKHAAGRAARRFEARVTLHAAAQQIAHRIPAYAGTVEPIDANTCRYTISDDDLSWLALHIAMLGVDFEVHEPPELLEHLRTLALRLARAAP